MSCKNIHNICTCYEHKHSKTTTMFMTSDSTDSNLKSMETQQELYREAKELKRLIQH